jgi:hypothetical protein
VDLHPLAFHHGYAGALLPTMLQGKEAEIGESGYIISRREDAEDPTFIMWAIEIRVEVVRV